VDLDSTPHYANLKKIFLEYWTENLRSDRRGNEKGDGGWGRNTGERTEGDKYINRT
jgi:hypothetical protein